MIELDRVRDGLERLDMDTLAREECISARCFVRASATSLVSGPTSVYIMVMVWSAVVIFCGLKVSNIIHLESDDEDAFQLASR